MDYRERLDYQGSEPFLCYAATDINEGVKAGRSGVFVRKCYTVECNIRGSGSVILNGREYKVKAGDCYALFPGDKIEYVSDKGNPRYGIWCYLGGDKVGRALSEAGISSENPLAPASAFDGAKDIIHKMCALSAERDIGSEYMRTALVYELLAVITKGKSSQNGDLWLKRAVAIMEASYNKNLTVSELAAKVGFERSYFSTVFKERMGLSPHEYLTSVRISRARELLSGSDLPISECAEAVGLDARNFARLFRAETGLAPMEFKIASRRKEYKKIL